MGYRTTDQKGVEGPVSSTDNRIVTFNGTTGKLIKDNTGFTISGGSRLIGNTAGSEIVLKETGTGPTGFATWGYIWVKNDDPTTLIFTDDADTDHQLAYNSEIVTAHGALTGLANDDHTQYSLVDGTRAFTGPIEVDSAVAAITLGERSTPGTPAAGKAILYAKTDGLMYSRDDAGVETLMSSGPVVTDHGNLDGLADDDHTQYARTDGTRAFTGPIEVDSATASITVGEHSTAPATPATGKVAVYAKTDGKVYSKDDAGTETGLSGDVAGPGSSTDNAVAKFDSTTGKIIQNSNVLVSDAGALVLSGTTDPMISMEERAVAPSSTPGQGRWFVRTDGANSALPNQTPWFTNDNSIDQRLGMQHTTVSFVVSPSATVTWYTWGEGGPYNDVIWSDAAGTGAAPTTSTWFSRPPLILIPGDAQVERVLGWYQSEIGTVGTWEFELVAVAIQDADTSVGGFDPIVDGSINSDFSVTNAKVTLLSHTVNDRTMIPTDTNHMTGLYMAYRETTALNSDLRGTVTIYWSTYTLDGWVSDGFATS